jgi:hypothetical protein
MRALAEIVELFLILTRRNDGAAIKRKKAAGAMRRRPLPVLADVR